MHIGSEAATVFVLIHTLLLFIMLIGLYQSKVNCSLSVGLLHGGIRRVLESFVVRIPKVLLFFF